MKICICILFVVFCLSACCKEQPIVHYDFSPEENQWLILGKDSLTFKRSTILGDIYLKLKKYVDKNTEYISDYKNIGMSCKQYINLGRVYSISFKEANGDDFYITQYNLKGDEFSIRYTLNENSKKYGGDGLYSVVLKPFNNQYKLDSLNFYNTLTIDGFAYSNVYTYKDGHRLLVINKEYGILQFADTTGNIWNLVQ